MKNYNVALSFYVEESADDLETAKTHALSKIRYKGNVMRDLDATGIKEPNDWREITITKGGQGK